MKSAYFVPTDWLANNKPRDDYDVQIIPADPAQTFLIVRWDNPNWEREFESNPEVRHLGFAWEPMDADAIALLASLPGAPVAQTTAASSALLPSVDTPAPSVARVLKGLAWPAASRLW